MNGEPSPADSRRFARLAEQMRDKRYRDSYVASHTRQMLARQMRKFRGDASQAAFAETLGKRQTVISRLENPGYTGWTLRTLFDIANALNVAVFVRFVDFATFLKYSDDLSERAMRPSPYDQHTMDELAKEDERLAKNSALKALFSVPPTQEISRSAKNIDWSPQGQVTFAHGEGTIYMRPANDSESQTKGTIGSLVSRGPVAMAAE
jgi:hypothetical protein